MEAAHLFLGFGDGVPTGDCVTMGNHQANYEHARAEMVKVDKTNPAPDPAGPTELVSEFDENPALTRVEWWVCGFRVAHWKFS